MSVVASSAAAQRARAVAVRELRALAARTPCIRGMDQLVDDRFKLHVALPYLGLGPDPEAPVRREGFCLAVALHPRHPDLAPAVHFLAPHVIFHPAVSPILAAFCLGPGVWTPDLGLARYVVIHLEAVVGLCEIDTLDAIFGDPVCAAAAAHYRRLRADGGLPLATPAFPAADADGAAPRVPEPMAPAPQAGVMTVRGPRGRRAVVTGPGPQPGEILATCVLADPGWVHGLDPAGRAGLDWLADRIGGAGEARLVQVDAAPALRITVTATPGRSLREAIAERLEPALRRWELAVLSFSDRRIAAAVAAARSGADSHLERSDEHAQHAVG